MNEESEGCRAEEARASYETAKSQLANDPLILLKALAKTSIAAELRDALADDNHLAVVAAAFVAPQPTVASIGTTSRESLLGKGK